MAAELLRITQELETVGYSLTSYAQLNTQFDTTQAAALRAQVDQSDGSQSALEVVRHITKNSMTIVQDERCMDIGRAMLKPVIDVLFADSQEARESWSLFGMNRYEIGGKFGPHRDEVGASVLVVTISGVRVFDVYDTEPEFKQADLHQVEATFELSEASIMILDGEKDPGHAVALTKDASIVAVADVPFLLRTSDSGGVHSIPCPPAPPIE